ncbi:hypothetical protein [Lentzea sp. NPDC092896]|uniref:hypothetical protein n=1 Tax=Lentzea sp. NPDC092896 TaxID=3364127 RepID=UPI00381D4750
MSTDSPAAHVLEPVTTVDHIIDCLGPTDTDRLPLVANLITLRLQDLAATHWLIPDAGQRNTVMRNYVLMWGGHALQRGEIDLATSRIPVAGERKSPVPQAAAVWLHCDQPESQPAPAPQNYARRLTEYFGPFAARAAELDALFEKHRPLDRGPYDCLRFLAAAHEGLGLDAELLRYHLDELDCRGLGAYLVAADEGSRALYEQHGFEQLDRVLELGAGCAGPAHVMYPMWRWPNPSTARLDAAGRP